MQILIDQDGPIRLIVFGGLLVVFALAEAVWPRRDRAHPRTGRWLSNLGVSVVNTLVLRLVFPVLAVGAAAWADSHRLGLLNWLGMAEAGRIVIALVLLDLLIWAQHVVFHKVPFFWRFHKMHHLDLDLDVTSGIRFHPIEIVFSMAIKMAAVVALGAPVVAVILFEVVLNATSLFNHANLALPRSVDRLLRHVLVTPDMHRVHHSVCRDETDSNFGFNVPWWDRLFGTYRDQPGAGHRAMEIGLAERRDLGGTLFGPMLWAPFAKEGQQGPPGQPGKDQPGQD